MRIRAVALAALLLLAIAVLIGLGVWQLQRNEWRNGLVAERNARLDAPPASVAELRDIDLDDLDYRRGHLEGTWDLDRHFIIANRARVGVKGEEIVVPLLPDEGGPAVLVNRGWYQEDRREEVLGALAGEERASIDGLVRYHESLSARETNAGTWTRTAPASMVKVLPYDAYPWYVIEGELDGEGPAEPATPAMLMQGYPRYESHIPHVEYALTWFGIAAALVAVAVIRFFVAPRRERAARQERPEPSI